MRKIQSGDVHAEAHKVAQHGFRVTRRPDSADYFGSPSSRPGLRHLVNGFVQFTCNQLRLILTQRSTPRFLKSIACEPGNAG
jgi:hypothetical protein